MKKDRFGNMYLLITIMFMFTFLFSSCGTTEPPPPPVPEGITTVNGAIYKAVLGSSQTDNPVEFIVRDENSQVLSNQWVHFSCLIGDGSFVSDSLQTDSTGIVTCQYVFDGDLGHSAISALVRDVDTVSVEIRANTLIPGALGQGQYILFEDNYGDVKEWLGEPEIVDVDPTNPLFYAVYENSLGVVVMIDDLDINEVISDTDGVHGVIVNTVYTGKTKDSLGIGSTLADVRALYGTVGEFYDPTPPPAYYYKYPQQGMTVFTDTTANEPDRLVIELHFTENITTFVSKKSGTSALKSMNCQDRNYRNIR